MKTILSVFLLAMLVGLNIKAQEIHKSPTRRLSTFTAVYECSITGENPNLQVPINAQAGALFDSIGVKEIGSTKYFIIKFLNYNGNSKLQAVYNFKVQADSLETLKSQKIWIDPNLLRFFLISESDFLGKSKSYIRENTFSMTYGAMTIPLKLRFENDKIYDSSKDITLGSVGGLRFKPLWLKGNSLVSYFGIGITSVSLDSSNTFGEISGASDRSAVTLTTGLMFESRNGIQLGITAGWDFIGQKEQLDWVNNGNLWLGFGIGFSLFSESKPSISINQNTNDTKKTK